MNRILAQFAITGNPIECTRYGKGHINETYLVNCADGEKYILQKINKNVFTQPEQLMENIAATTAYIAARTDDPRASLHLIPTLDGKAYYRDDAGEYWRVYDFVSSTICLQRVESARDLYYTGLAFGRFQSGLAAFPAETLHEPIKDFHNTPARVAQLENAIKLDKMNRVKDVAEEIDFVLNRPFIFVITGTDNVPLKNS